MMRDFLMSLPKAELHVHLEGTIEAEDMFKYAARNRISLPWESVEALRAAYSYESLSDFLQLYWKGCEVLCTREDFFEMTLTYLQRAAAQTVRRAEMFFSPQNFLPRGISMSEMIGGLTDAIAEAQARLGIVGAIIVIVQRQRSEAEAFELLEALRPYRDSILGIGLGGPEIGHPPSKFARLFAAARNEGYRLTAHAGEEAPPSYIREALDLCHVERIDHGYTAYQDPELVSRLADEGIGLTMCPLSNLRLKVVDDLSTYPIESYMKAGVIVSVNSDDPPCFGGYINENFEALAEHLNLGIAELTTIARNSFASSFASPEEVAAGIEEVTRYEKSRNKADGL
jgi:adenosine deaminase